MNATQFQFLMMLLGGIGAIVMVELFLIASRLNDIRRISGGIHQQIFLGKDHSR